MPAEPTDALDLERPEIESPMFKMPLRFAMLILILLSTPHATALPNFERLLETQDHKREEPLVVLSDLPGQFDPHRHQENLAYLNQDKRFLSQIKSHFNSDTLDWTLAGSFKRLLVVPEQREDFAALFEQYCRQAIAHTLMRTQLPDPYLNITTLAGPVAIAEGKTPMGVSAYLVHNIAEEYVEEFLFYDQAAAESTKVKIELRNRVFSGKIGSYSSRLTMGHDSTVEWSHEAFTLWQNSARDPLNVLIVPVEETLHIALRAATAGAIEQNIAQTPRRKIKEVQQVVDMWMAVEEALVGGIVAQLMPEILGRLLSGPMQEALTRSLAERDAHDQYRYLQAGIRVVMELGLLPAITLYQASPMEFKRMVSQVEDGLFHAPARTGEQVTEAVAEAEPLS
jgi:hypothetical protein